jgi:hypothetical protein
MFVRTSTTIHIPFEHVVESFCRNPGEWLAPLATEALPDGETLRASLGLGTKIPVGKSVMIRFGHGALRTEHRATLPIRLEATGPKGLFPQLDADLSVLPSADGSATEIELQGIYRPPLDGFGEMLDRMALHPVAERSLNRLTERIATALQAAIAERDPSLL